MSRTGVTSPSAMQVHHYTESLILKTLVDSTICLMIHKTDGVLTTVDTSNSVTYGVDLSLR